MLQVASKNSVVSFGFHSDEVESYSSETASSNLTKMMDSVLQFLDFFISFVEALFWI